MALNVNVRIGGAMKGSRFYSHSGTVPVLGPLAMVGLGGLTALLLGVVYGYAIFYIPFIYLNLILVFVFGGAVGYVVGLAAKLAKVRNNAALLAIALAVGLFAQYVGWVAWILAITEQQVLALSPGAIFQVMTLVGQEGGWTVFGVTPTGLGLYSIWLLEGLIILGCVLIGAYAVVGTRPFCEPCDRWVEEKVSLPRLQPCMDPERLRGKLMAGRYEEIAALGRATTSTNPFTRVEMLRCPGCDSKYFLTLSNVETSVDKDGKPQESTQVLVENLIINRDVFHQLQTEPAPNVPPGMAA